jgi:flagellar hook assembly protein FlgD
MVYEVPGKRISQKLGINSTPVRISIKIYDIVGRLIKTLIDGPKEPGVYTIVWNGEDESGKEVGTGVYFCRFKAGEKQTIRKIICVK